MSFLDTKSLNDLIQILEQETVIYDDLLKISKNKTGIIVEGKVNELENIMKVEMSLILQLGKVETARESLVDKISVKLNLKSSEVTITELLKHVKGPEVDKLKDCQINLTKSLSDLKNSNEMNSKLIKNSLDFIDFSINLMSGVDTGTNNYGNSGQVNDSKKRNFFDMKL